MQLEQKKTAVVGAWLIAWTVMALLVDVSSTNWILLVALGALPPLILLRLWRPPARSTSERIREVLK